MAISSSISIHPLTLNFRPAQASPPSSRPRVFPATAPSSFPSPSGDPRVESPSPGFGLPRRLPLGFSSGASTCSTRQSSPPHPRTVFLYGRVLDSSLPHKSIPEGSRLDSRELESGSPPKERPRPRSAPPPRPCLGRPGAWSRPEGVTAGRLGTTTEPTRPRLELRTHQAEVTIPRAASTTAGLTNQLP